MSKFSFQAVPLGLCGHGESNGPLRFEGAVNPDLILSCKMYIWWLTCS